MVRCKSQAVLYMIEGLLTCDEIFARLLQSVVPLPCQKAYARNLAAICAMHLRKNALMDAGFFPEDLPSGSAIFVAGSGMGKTYLIAQMAKLLNWDPRRLLSNALPLRREPVGYIRWWMISCGGAIREVERSPSISGVLLDADEGRCEVRYLEGDRVYTPFCRKTLVEQYAYPVEVGNVIDMAETLCDLYKKAGGDEAQNQSLCKWYRLIG